MNNRSNIAKISAAAVALSLPLVSLTCSGTIAASTQSAIVVGISAALAIGFLAARHRSQAVAGDAAIAA